MPEILLPIGSKSWDRVTEVMDPHFGLHELVREMRKLSATDVEFAQRVALVCCNLIETKQHPLEAIRTVFRIQ